MDSREFREQTLGNPGSRYIRGVSRYVFSVYASESLGIDAALTAPGSELGKVEVSDGAIPGNNGFYLVALVPE
jgi:hypothetical protein